MQGHNCHLNVFLYCHVEQKRQVVTPNTTRAKRYLTIKGNSLKTLSNQRNLRYLGSIPEISICKKAFTISPIVLRQIRISNKRGLACGPLYKQLLKLWLPQVTGDTRNLEQSCDTAIASFVISFFPLPWCSINHLIYVKKVSRYFVIIASRDL